MLGAMPCAYCECPSPPQNDTLETFAEVAGAPCPKKPIIQFLIFVAEKKPCIFLYVKLNAIEENEFFFNKN